jgi:hypothetical protein
MPIAFALLFGCTNGNVKSMGNSLSTSQGSTISENPDSTNPPTTNFATISNVVPSNADPQTVLDILPGSGTDFSKVCTNAKSGISCQCLFTFKTQAGTQERATSNITYVENNLMRCSISDISSNINQVSFSLVNSAGEFSNSKDITLNRDIRGFDTKSLINWRSVNRTMCREVLTLPNLLSPNVYDPFMSELSGIQNTYNYYSSNFAFSIGGFYALKTDGKFTTQPFECLPIPYATQTAGPNSKYSFDLTITSQANVPSPTPMPINGFYLFKNSSKNTNQPVQPFTAPVKARVAPGLSASDGVFVIGYGVKPAQDPSGNAEYCPDEDNKSNYTKYSGRNPPLIPPRFEWVKVWQFRAELPNRPFLVNKSKELEQLERVSCLPSDSSGFSCPADSSSNLRLLRNGGACVSLSSGSSTYGTFVSGDNSQDAEGFHGLKNLEQNVTLSDINNELTPGSRFDFLFVTTPPSVMSSQFLDGSALNHFRPKRQIKRFDNNNYDLNYEYFPYDLNTMSSGPNLENEEQDNAFPICAIRSRN